MLEAESEVLMEENVGDSGLSDFEIFQKVFIEGRAIEII